MFPLINDLRRLKGENSCKLTDHVGLVPCLRNPACDGAADGSPAEFHPHCFLFAAAAAESLCTYDVCVTAYRCVSVCVRPGFS